MQITVNLTRFWLFLCFALNLLAVPPANGRVSQHPEVVDALKVLDAWVGARVAAREQPGLSIGIVYDQELIWAKGYGYADQEKKILATPSTLYRIASISKLFTSTAILQLRDAGKLQLDDPVVPSARAAQCGVAARTGRATETASL